MGFFDIFKTKKSNNRDVLKSSIKIVNSLAKEGRTKIGYFKCVRCNKIYSISYFACYGFVNIKGKNTTRAICRFCLELDKERGVKFAWGKPIEETMRTGEALALAYLEATVKRIDSKKNKKKT